MSKKSSKLAANGGEETLNARIIDIIATINILYLRLSGSGKISDDELEEDKKYADTWQDVLEQAMNRNDVENILSALRELDYIVVKWLRI